MFALLSLALALQEPSFQEKRLAVLEKDLFQIVFHPLGREVAYTIRASKKDRVVTGSDIGPEFDQVERLQYGPGGKLQCYIGRSRVGQSYTNRVVVNGKAGVEHSGSIQEIVFSPDGSEYAYTTMKDGRLGIIMHRDKEISLHDGVSLPSFSPDGKTLAFAVYEAGARYVIVGDRKEEKLSGVSRPVFHPNGKSLAYAGQWGTEGFVVLDGKRGPTYSGAGEPKFSADGSVLVHPARVGSKWRVVVQGKSGEEYDGVENLQVSADGKTVAYAARADQTWYCVVNGKPSEAYTQVLDVRVSPGGLVAYQARKKQEYFVVCGDKAEAPVGTVGTIVMSPDDRTCAYLVQSGGKWQVVVAGSKRSEPFNEVYAPVFSKDGSQVAFGAKKGKELWWKVLAVR